MIFRSLFLISLSALMLISCGPAPQPDTKPEPTGFTMEDPVSEPAADLSEPSDPIPPIAEPEEDLPETVQEIIKQNQPEPEPEPEPVEEQNEVIEEEIDGVIIIDDSSDEAPPIIITDEADNVRPADPQPQPDEEPEEPEEPDDEEDDEPEADQDAGDNDFEIPDLDF